MNVDGLLRVEPELRRGPEGRAKLERHFGGHRAAAVHDAVDHLDVAAKVVCKVWWVFCGEPSRSSSSLRYDHLSRPRAGFPADKPGRPTAPRRPPCRASLRRRAPDWPKRLVSQADRPGSWRRRTRWFILSRTTAHAAGPGAAGPVGGLRGSALRVGRRVPGLWTPEPAGVRYPRPPAARHARTRSAAPAGQDRPGHDGRGRHELRG